MTAMQQEPDTAVQEGNAWRQQLKLQLVQLEVAPNVEENIRRMQGLLDPAADFALLPELWNCPYDNDMILQAASRDRDSRRTMSQAAAGHHLWLAGSIPWRQNGHIYNMAFVFDDQGLEVCRYAKTHLMEVNTTRSHYSEADVFTPGEAFCAFETPWGRMGILVCYDIRFPEPARLLAQAGIRVLLLPAAFNEAAGQKHWQPLLCTRALENQIFAAGCNPRYTWKGYKAWGHSLAVSPDGVILQEGPGTVELDLEQVDRIRQRMPYTKIRRQDLYRLESPVPVEISALSAGEAQSVVDPGIPDRRDPEQAVQSSPDKKHRNETQKGK